MLWSGMSETQVAATACTIVSLLQIRMLVLQLCAGSARTLFGDGVLT